ncbi:MAG: toprim domain-containing protein [Promethearchaeota archaeon]
MQLISKQIGEIKKLLGALKHESKLKTTLLIVEGMKDVQALYNFGIQTNILHLQGRPLIEICDLAAAFKKIIILTDFDNAGQKLAKNLQQNLSFRGINVDLTYYHKLKFYFKKVSKDIESLFKIYQQIALPEN